MIRPPVILAALVVTCFTLGASLAPTASELAGSDRRDGLLRVIFGDSRQMFGDYFFKEADVYFHSGYYPSFFDQARAATVTASHLTEHHEDGKDDHDEEPGMDFLGKPKDWVDRFGRNFYSSTHSHLDKPGEAREILPWLKLSAESDPHRIETYTVASWWLRNHLGKVREAEQFLRQGFRANQDSYEILLELGNLYYDNYHDAMHARNIWERGVKLWYDQDDAGRRPDVFALQQLNVGLARLEENEGNFGEAIKHLEAEKAVSPSPDQVQKRIDELKQKAGAAPGGNEKREPPSVKK